MWTNIKYILLGDMNIDLLKYLWSKKLLLLIKVKKNGVFLFGTSLFVLEIFAFFYYANEESDDIINSSTTQSK